MRAVERGVDDAVGRDGGADDRRFLRDKPHAFPLNIPNTGQAPDLPTDVVVEACASPTATGCTARDQVRAAARAGRMAAPGLGRAGATVEAARRRATATRSSRRCCSTRSPGRIDFDHVEQMTDEMLAATAQWLPQFA